MLPFDQLQEIRNPTYYRSRGLRLYRDFKTFGSCIKLAEANAIEFYQNAQMHWPDAGELRVYEIGIGSGNFALHFLETLKRLDLKLARRVVYFACDFSQKLLRSARERLDRFSVETLCRSAEKIRIRKAHYVRSIELFDDLPAKIFIREDRIYEVLFSSDAKKHTLRACRNSPIARCLQIIPPGYQVPVNLVAARCLAQWKTGLLPGGYLDIFDYGFCSPEEILRYTPELWNPNVIRKFNKQLTCDVNFHWLQVQFPELQLQPQKQYVERVLKQRLYYVEMRGLNYLTLHEIKAQSARFQAHGYEKNFFTYAEELDSYVHARLRKTR